MSEDIIDGKAIRRLLDVIGGDTEDLLELVEEFQEVTPGLLQKIQSAATNSDYNSIRILAHSLKSNARDFGATTLARLCEKLEHECKNETVFDINGQVGAISGELEAARSEIVRLTRTNE